MVLVGFGRDMVVLERWCRVGWEVWGGKKGLGELFGFCVFCLLCVFLGSFVGWVVLFWVSFMYGCCGMILFSFGVVGYRFRILDGEE